MISPKIWTEKKVDAPLMQNEGKTDNRKAIITFSFNNLRAPSESRMFIFCLLHQFTTQLYTHAILALLDYGLI